MGARRHSFENGLCRQSVVQNGHKLALEQICSESPLSALCAKALTRDAFRISAVARPAEVIGLIDVDGREAYSVNIEI